MPPRDTTTCSVAFSDFWRDADERMDFFMQALGPSARRVANDEKPDILIYSVFGNGHRKFGDERTAKVFYTGENIAPDFNECDYAISFEHLEYGDRHLRMPLWAFHPEAEALGSRPALTPEDLSQKQKFCAYVVSSAPWSSTARRDFFLALHKRQAVVSAGRHLNNHPAPEQLFNEGSGRKNKLRFLSDFRFSMAFENSQHPGYTTEKIMDAFLARTIPIYWGDPRVAEDFNPAAFVNVQNYHDFDAAIDDILSIAANEQKLLAMLNAPVFHPGTDPFADYHRQLSAFLGAIVQQPPEARRRRPLNGRARMAEVTGGKWHLVIRHAMVRLWRDFSERKAPPPN